MRARAAGIVRFGGALLLFCSAACVPSASIETQPTPVEPEPQASGPRYARASGSATLYADPNASAYHVELQAGPGTPPERVFELIEPDPSGAWWRVRTLLPRQALALGLDPSVALPVLSLEGWIDARQLTIFEPIAGTQPAVASATPALAGAVKIRFKIAAGTLLRWPDGRVAGEAVEDHGFFMPASLLNGASNGEHGEHLMCHEHRTMSGVTVQGWLCTSEGEVPSDPVPNLVALDVPGKFVELEPGSEQRGAIDRDIIRRIVRANINEVRDCYNVGLGRDPTLAGRVSIDFVISGDGSVSSAMVKEDTLADPSVGQCIAKAVETWEFPKPKGGGNVVVTYPFNLTPG